MRFATTVILALILAGVALVIYFHGEDAGRPEETPAAAAPLFPDLVPAAVDRIEMSMYMGRRAVLERAEGDLWKIKEPFADFARQEIVAQLLEALDSNPRVLLPLTKEERDLPSKGLDPPKYSLSVTDSRGVHSLRVGARDPFRSEVFVMIDGDENLYRTGANLLNILEMNPEDLRDERAFRIDPLLVERVRIDGPEGLIMEAEKTSGLWEIKGPYQVDANSGAIQNLVSRLTSLKVEGRMHEGPLEKEQKAQYGLAGGDFRITLEAGPVARQVVLEPEGSGPGGGHCCIRDGEAAVVYVDAAEIEEILAKPLNYYRSRELLPPVRESLTTLRVLRGGAPFLGLMRHGESKHFLITEPFKAPADNISDGNSTPIYQFLVKVDGIRIQAFEADGVLDLASYGLDPPELTLELDWRLGGTPQHATLVFSEPEGKNDVFAARTDRPGPYSVFRVSAADLAPLLQDPLLLRDRRVFPQDIGAIRSARFECEGKRFEIRRGEGEFFVDDPGSRFQQFLNQMKNELVVRYEADPTLNESPLFEALAGSIEVRFEEGADPPSIRVDFGAPSPEGWYGRSSELSRGVFILKNDFLKDFRKLFDGL